MSVATEAPFEWAPHVIVEVDTFTKERTGMFGRAIAVRENGMEFIVMAKNAEQLDLVTRNFMGFEIDAAHIYKSVMIANEGIEIKVPAVEPETPAAPPVKEEVPIGPVVPEVPPLPTPYVDDDEL